MNRREFLKTAAAGAALSTLGPYVAGTADAKPVRVGLIGALVGLASWTPAGCCR